MTSRTGAIAVDIASDKSLTNQLLSAAGLPVPRSEVVGEEEEAVRAARSIGFPCVVKPLDGNHGRGVNLDLRDDAAVRRAFPIALEQSRNGDVVVESYVAGNDYRWFVIGGRVPATAERGPASVTGDGERTVRALVAVENADPRRGIGHEKVLTKIKVDAAAEELLRTQGWELDAVPPKGTWIKLALTGNMSTGGTSIDRTVEAHPENVEIAETAARVVGLDVAGIDFIVPDIAIPVRDQGGAIVEVNAAPGFRMHTHPTVGEPQYVARPVLDLLFPPGTPARIPIVAVTGTNGKTTTVRMIAHILKLMGRRVGMTTTDGIVIDGRLIKRGDMSGPKSAQMVLQNPSVDTAVFEVARGGILREGLGYDRNDVAVVTNVTGDHLGLGGITTLRQLADVKGVVVEAVPRSGTAVLNADDPHVARLARHSHGKIVYFSMATGRDEDGWLRVDSHCGRGGLGGRRPPARHPAGAADLLDLLLPGARQAQPHRDERLQGRHRLLPQRGRHAPPGRVRGAHDGRRRAGPETRSRAYAGRRAGRAGRAGTRGHRHPRRPARPRPARVRGARRHRLRSPLRTRGPQPARPEAWRVGGQRARRGRDGAEARAGPHRAGRRRPG